MAARSKTPRYEYRLALKAYENANCALNEARRSWEYAHKRLLTARAALDAYILEKINA